MKKPICKGPVFLLRLLGSLFLGGAYLAWRLTETGLSPAGQLASLASLVLFWAIGYQFTPVLVNSWTPGVSLPSFREEKAPPVKRVQVWIFLALLIFSAGIYLWVYFIRKANGTVGNFGETLSFWTCLDSGHYLDIARDW